MSGSETFKGAAAKAHAFWSPTPEDTRNYPSLKQEVFLNMGTKHSPEISRISQQTDLAYNGLRKELGKWITATYDVPSGLILKVFGQFKGGWNNLQSRACIYLQMRETGPHQKVRIPLTQLERSRFQFAEYEGRFDILPLTDVEQLGVVVKPQFRRLCEQDAVNRVFIVEVLNEEMEPRKRKVVERIRNADGKTVTVVRTKRTRALEI